MAALALALGGCPPDLSGWRVEGEAPAHDGSTPPPPRDGSLPPSVPCAPEVTCASCPMPWLLASVEDLGGRCGGQVWRWSIQGQDDVFCACEPLTAGGRMPRLPFSVGFVPPDTVVVAAEDDRVVAIDAARDAVRWERPYTWQPVDVFAIEDPTGQPMAGVAGRTRGGSIRAITFFDLAGAGAPIERTVNGDLPLGLNVASVTQSPFSRRWFRALDSMGSYAAADVDPWTNERFMDPPHTAGREGFYLRTLHASFDGTFHRTVWTGERSDLDPRVREVYRLARADDAGDQRVPLGERCTESADRRDYDVLCEYLHAVADPALNTSSFALCGHSGAERRIVRLSLTGICRTIVEQAAVQEGLRISRLGLAQPTFWP
ncbi:MAG: hypothetical protein KF729_16315 [Sandaracinaceae bacterium]|nr:hypothetical protein [Sandaracinaceae bacterium]